MSEKQLESKIIWRDKYDKYEYAEGESFPHAKSPVKEFKPERIEELLEKEWIGYKEEPEVDLEELTVAELKELADERNLEYKSNITKVDLLKLLK